MRLRPYIPETDFDVIRNWISDPRAHALWCADRFAYPLSRENFDKVLREIRIRNGDSPFVAVGDDGTVTGFFCYSLHPETGEGLLKFVIVDPAVRGRGAGKAMLRLAADYAFGISKAEALTLRVFTENPRAIRCYESVGFIEEKTDPGAFAYQDESWGRTSMTLRRPGSGYRACGQYTVRYNELTAEQFIELWESVWGDGPTPEQTALAMEHTLFRVSVFDGEKIVAMARMIGDLGLDYYIKDVIVRPEYQRRGIGKLLIRELLSFIRRNGVRDTAIFTELCAMPDKIPFYAQFGFAANEAQRLKQMIRADGGLQEDDSDRDS